MTAPPVLDLELLCVLADGPLDDKGYGRVYRDGRNHRAHKLAYEDAHGPVPEGLVLDHLCRNRACVNPAHLEPVTPAENLRRSPIAPATINRSKTHCPSGHEYSAENTRIDRDGWRRCRACAKAQSLAGYYRWKARQAEVRS